MADLAPGWIALLVSGQVIVFVALALIFVKLLKVIKSQNNGVVLPPDVTQKLRKMFKGSKKP
jgi:hypothetical protein